jgi:hypothetical protein
MASTLARSVIATAMGFPMKRPKHPLHKLADEAIDYMDDLLFHGSVFGGQSLVDLVAKYKEEGPFGPTRGMLLAHLHRCHENMIVMGAYIVARARTMPHGQVVLNEKRRAAKRAKYFETPVLLVKKPRRKK